MSSSRTEPTAQPAPRLVKAGEIATRNALREAEANERRERNKHRIAEMLKQAASGNHGPRDARAVFDSLFQNPTPA